MNSFNKDMYHKDFHRVFLPLYAVGVAVVMKNCISGQMESKDREKGSYDIMAGKAAIEFNHAIIVYGTHHRSRF